MAINKEMFESTRQAIFTGGRNLKRKGKNCLQKTGWNEAKSDQRKQCEIIKNLKDLCII